MSNAKKVSEAADNYWVPYGNGYEMTQSRQLIASRLKELKERKLPLVLVHEKYQSGPSLLLGFEKGRLLIDKPRDWPGTENKIRVIYRDRSNLWNHFYCVVATASSDTLYVTVPTRYFILQRRTHYRVEAPSGSTATFVHQNVLHSDIQVRDLSAGGMLMASQTPLPIDQGSTLEEIMLTIPVENDQYPATLLCQSGDVIRATQDKQKRLFLFGIDFQATEQEEEAIIRYVRQRELELLRRTAEAAD